jgi:dTDP-4-dehydrorhamnose reductase
LDHSDVDLADAEGIRKWVRDTAPTIVVNAAGYTAVDKAESEPDRAMRVNGVAPGILAEEARRIGALLVHYSTDYVFDGAKAGPYVEEDQPNPLGAYGRSKLSGEQAIQQVDGNYLIFRLCWVYGERGNNFMLTITRLARERKTLRVVRDQVGCPTWSRMIAEATALALRQVISAGDFCQHKGIFHLAASGETSWYGFAESILGLMPGESRKCEAINAIPTEEYPSPAKRPANSVLCCEKLRRTFGLSLPHWEEQLKLVLNRNE